jgi:hypothetical protein
MMITIEGVFAMPELILKSFAEQHGRMQWPGMTPQAACSVLRAIAGPSTFRELAFNSLDAQREACAAFIQSQKQSPSKAVPSAQ